MRRNEVYRSEGNVYVDRLERSILVLETPSQREEINREEEEEKVLLERSGNCSFHFRSD